MREFSLSMFFAFLFFIFNSRYVLASNITLVVPQCHPDESSALIQFKTSYSNRSPKMNTWQEGTNCCTWSGIACDAVTWHVIGLDLSRGGLQGAISSNSSLFRLRHLQRLDLSGNNFRGSRISPEFGQFKNLTHLSLVESSFVGLVPSEISHLSKLVSLAIGQFDPDNPPVRIEPDTFNLLARNFTSLRELDLSYTDMSLVPLVSFLNLSSSLTSLHLRDCGLSGEFSDKDFQLPQLQELVLERNYFNGSIPSSFLNFGNLTFLHLSANRFVGKFPEVCSNCSSKNPMTTLSALLLHDNLFSGTIPSWIFSLPDLVALNLGKNLFTGKLEEFRSTSLQIIWLGQNNLVGNIPRSIYKQVELQNLDLSRNNFTGTVELEELSKLNMLSSLQLSYSNLSFSSSISIDYTFHSLSYLGLSSCNISKFPEFFRSSKGLISLDLSRNHIQGVVPNFLWEMAKDSLYILDLSDNYLTHIEPLPWNKLMILDLSSNLFSGSLPLAPFASFYHVSKNNFSGEVPDSFCNMTSLEVLVLSYNNLSGQIPSCFQKILGSLTVFDLQMNNLGGKIPLDFAKGNSMRSLNLNGNKFDGPLPFSLLNCENIEVLDVGNNKISGPFPRWLESLPELQVLILRSNRFYGPVSYPEVSLPFQKLRIMDLSNNDFRGPLPTKYFKNFSAMINAETNEKLEYMESASQGFYYQDSVRMVIKGISIEMEKIQKMFITIDFSRNNFTGEIPDSIGKLSSLKGLNFSHNRLIGVIPAELGSLSNLESLDISSNELSGKIPSELAENLSQLQILNLSGNKLEGPIPRGPQFNTFNNDSYRGNSRLCGFPLSKSCTENAIQKEESDNEEPAEDKITMDWKVVMMGYGSGVVIGISIGYMMFFSRRFDYWLMEKFRGRFLQHKTITRFRGRRRV